jgi:hypothetical protein
MRHGTMRYRRSRLPRVLKWGGLVAYGAVLAAFVISIRYEVRWTSPRRKHTIRLHHGAIEHVTHHWLDDGFPPPRHVWARLDPPGWDVVNHEPGLWVGVLMPNTGRSGVSRTAVGLWLPVVLATFFVVWAWRRDRGLPEGRCQNCGYDLTGNTSGTCPECGEAA